VSILQQKRRTKRYMVDLKMFMCNAKIALIMVIKKARGHNGRAILKKQTNQNEKPQITQILKDCLRESQNLCNLWRILYFN